MSIRRSMFVAGKQGREFCLDVACRPCEGESSEIQREQTGDIVVFGRRLLLLRLDYLDGIGHTCIEAIIDLGESLASVLPIGLGEFDLTQGSSELDKGSAHILLHLGFLVLIFSLPLTQCGPGLLHVRTDLPTIEYRDADRSRSNKDALGIVRPGANGAVLSLD